MSRILASCLLIAGAVLWTVASVPAQDALPGAPAVPLAPVPASPAPATFVIPPRQNPYDVWQYYAVDRYGRFRPRVVVPPQGAYYLYNGVHYPWTTTRTMEVMPYLMD